MTTTLFPETQLPRLSQYSPWTHQSGKYFLSYVLFLQSEGMFEIWIVRLHEQKLF